MLPVLGCAASMTTEWKVAFNTIILHTHSWMLMQLYWEKSSFRFEATELTYTMHRAANTERNRKNNIIARKSLRWSLFQNVPTWAVKYSRNIYWCKNKVTKRNILLLVCFWEHNQQTKSYLSFLCSETDNHFFQINIDSIEYCLIYLWKRARE